MGLLSVFKNNSENLDTREAEAKLLSESPKLLGPNESIKLAFRSSLDTREKNYLTSHRLLFKNGVGLSTKQKHYLSIPYTSIKAFAVKTAGGTSLSVSTALQIWYDDGEHTVRFAKDSVDIFEVQQFFNEKCFLQVKNTGTTTTDTNLAKFSSDIDFVKQATNVETVFNWLGNDFVQIDPKSMQDRFGYEAPCPILMSGEEVEVAYKTFRDMIIITPKRFLLVDVLGFTGKKIKFMSLRWQYVKAYAVETAGRFDRDGDFVLYTSIPTLPRLCVDLRKGKTDIFQLQMAFCNKLLGGEDTPSGRVPKFDQHKGHIDAGASLIGDGNMRPLDAAKVERVYRSSPCLLQDDESVEMAFLGIRDLVIFTTKRIIDVDKKGFSGKKVEYTSIPYTSILAFAAVTAGKNDFDAELKIYTEIKYNTPPEAEEADPGASYIEWDFNKYVFDVLDLKRYLNARLLETKPGMKVPTGLLAATEKDQGVSKILSILGEDQRTIDAEELDKVLHTTLDVLLDDENVVMAFKAYRDITCFTNRRVFILDKKGWSGQKVAYVSLPYSSIRAFSVESAGGWDLDSTVILHTKNYWDMGTMRLDFRKGKADIIAINNFLSGIILGSEKDAADYLKTVNSDTVKIKPLGSNAFTDMIIDFSTEKDPKVADAQFHSNPPILLDEERVEKVYQEGRDLWMYTTLRILKVNVKGMSGNKVKYKSIPFEKSVTSFRVVTVGNIDIDAECFMYTNIPSQRLLMQKVLVNKGDIFDLHEYFSNRMLDE